MNSKDYFYNYMQYDTDNSLISGGDAMTENISRETKETKENISKETKETKEKDISREETKEEKEEKQEGRVIMEEEVFATWFATSLIIAVMGTQFTQKNNISPNVRQMVDLITMLLAFGVLVWATLCHFDCIEMPKRELSLQGIIVFILVYYIFISILVACQKL